MLAPVSPQKSNPFVTIFPFFSFLRDPIAFSNEMSCSLSPLPLIFFFPFSSLLAVASNRWWTLLSPSAAYASYRGIPSFGRVGDRFSPLFGRWRVLALFPSHVCLLARLRDSPFFSFTTTLLTRGAASRPSPVRSLIPPSEDIAVPFKTPSSLSGLLYWTLFSSYRGGLYQTGLTPAGEYLSFPSRVVR